MLVYNYHHVTRAYLGESEADESPLEPGVWLIPADATDVSPPLPLPPRTVAVWNGTQWETKPDTGTTDYNCNEAPATLFGGPTIKEIFYGHE